MRYRNEREERLARELNTAESSNRQSAAIAVNERGVRCTVHVLNLVQGDETKPDYLKINSTTHIRF